MTMRITGGGGPVTGGGGSIDGDRHTVKKGETLQQIADQHGVSAEALAQSNPQLKNPEKLRAGTKMFIPPFKQGDSSAPSAPKDSFETAAKKSELDKMMESPKGTPAGKIPFGESKSFKTLPGESRAFNFGEAQVTKTPAGESKSFDPGKSEATGLRPPSGESKAFNFGESSAKSQKVSPGEIRSWGDPHTETTPQKGPDAESKLPTGELRSYGDPHTETIPTKGPDAESKLPTGEIRSYGDPHSETIPTDEPNVKLTDAARKLAPEQFVIKDGKVFVKDED